MIKQGKSRKWLPTNVELGANAANFRNFIVHFAYKITVMQLQCFKDM